MVAQGILGAFDTLYYHEYRARLPVLGAAVAAELRLHAFRDFVYAILFITLPTIAWCGHFVWLVAALLGLEIALTLRDFVIEDSARKVLGGVFSGERVTHGFMGIVYGLFLAALYPYLRGWSARATGFAAQQPVEQGIVLTSMALGAGVLLSGLRDLLCSQGVRWAAWPWSPAKN